MKRKFTYLTAALLCTAMIPAASAAEVPAAQAEPAARAAVIQIRPVAGCGADWETLLGQLGLPCGPNGCVDMGAGNPGADNGANGGADAGSDDAVSDNAGSDNGGTAELSAAAQVAALVNEQRAKNGLSPLTPDAAMSRAAQTRANELRQSFSHTRPNGTRGFDAMANEGVSYRAAGENIAYGQKTAEAVMNAWMNSAGHRANILGAQFGRIGVGAVTIGGTTYWVQLFAD